VRSTWDRPCVSARLPGAAAGQESFAEVFPPAGAFRLSVYKSVPPRAGVSPSLGFNACLCSTYPRRTLAAGPPPSFQVPAVSAGRSGRSGRSSVQRLSALRTLRPPRPPRGETSNRRVRGRPPGAPLVSRPASATSGPAIKMVNPSAAVHQGGGPCGSVRRGLILAPAPPSPSPGLKAGPRSSLPSHPHASLSALPRPARA